MLVVLGGSSPWTVELLEQLQTDEILLVGQNEEALESLRRFALVRCSTGIETSTDPATALSRATTVLCQARIGGWPGRLGDESGPLRWGAYGDETLGLGGLRGAIRARRKLAEWATLAHDRPTLMLSNPTDILTRWWAHHSHGPTISVCEVPTDLMRDLPAGTCYLGVNHLGWALPPDGDRIATRQLAMHDEFPALVERQRTATEQRAEVLAALSVELRKAIAANDQQGFDALLTRRPPHWYGSAVVPVLRAVCEGRPFHGVVGLPNGDRLPNLPRDLVVESIGTASAPDRDGVPDELIEEVERLGRGRELAWQALIDPNETTVRAFVNHDVFCDGVEYSQGMSSWVVSR
jgi:alpha-galactosidase/6-phospho-beta-glucosidase family protein